MLNCLVRRADPAVENGSHCPLSSCPLLPASSWANRPLRTWFRGGFLAPLGHTLVAKIPVVMLYDIWNNFQDCGAVGFACLGSAWNNGGHVENNGFGLLRSAFHLC